MSDDFDIYADLEHIEKEAKQENHELLALRQKIKELQEKVTAAEHEKTDIVRKNEILLENVSSLLLTAKAEIQRKDATINDLRKQCDNAVFRRKNHDAKTVNYETKFTQTTLTHPPNVGEQKLAVECRGRLRSKSRIDDGRESNHNLDHEQDWARHSKVAPERDRSHGRNRTTNRDKGGDRDQDRNRDHELDRYHDRDQGRNRNRNRDRSRDSDRDRDRDRRSERHRKSRHERHKEHHSNERSNVKENHIVSREKDLKLVKSRTRDQERSSCEKHAPNRHRPNEDDSHYKSKSRLSDLKQGYLVIDRRTPELRDATKHDTVTNTDPNHSTKQMKQKNINNKLQTIASNTSEQPSTSNDLFEPSRVDHQRFQQKLSKSTEAVDNYSNAQGIQICDDSRKQNRRNGATGNSDPIESCLQKDTEKTLHRTEKTSTKYEQNMTHVTMSSTISKKKNTNCNFSGVDQECIQQIQGNQTSVNVNCHQSEVGYSESPLKLITDSPTVSNCNEPSTEGNANSCLPTDDKSLHQSESTVLATYTSPERINDGPNSTKVSDDHIFKSANLDEDVMMLVVEEPGEGESCSLPIDMTCNEVGKGSCKITSASDSGNHAQINRTNYSDKKNDKHDKSIKKRSITEPADNLPNDASKEVQQNDLCQVQATKDELNVSASKPERKDDSLESTNYDTVQTNKVHGIQLNEPQESSTGTKHATLIPPNTLAESKDVPSASDGLVLKSASVDEVGICSASVSEGDKCGRPIDITRNEAGKGNSKDIGSIDAANHAQPTIIKELDKKQEKHRRESKVSKRKPRTERADNEKNDARTEMQQTELNQLKATKDEPNTLPLKRDRKDNSLVSANYDTIQTNTTTTHQLEESSSSTATKHADPAAPFSVVDTLTASRTDVPCSFNVRDDLILKSSNMDEADSSSSAPACSLTIDIQRNEVGKESCQNINSNDSANYAKTSITNELDKKEDKHNQSTKRKSRTKPADDEKNDASKEIQQNKVCPLNPTTNEPNPSPLQREGNDKSVKSSQYDTIQTKTTKECHEIHPNQPQERTSFTVMNCVDPTAPISVSDKLAGSKDVPRAINISDDLVLISASVDEAGVCSSSVSASDACNILADMPGNEKGKGSTKAIQSNVATDLAHNSTANEPEDKNDIHSKSCQRQLRTKSASVQNDVSSNKGTENEHCQSKPAADVVSNSPPRKREKRKVESSESSQHDYIQANYAEVFAANSTQELTCSVVTKNDNPAPEALICNVTANEMCHKYNLETNGMLPFANDVKDSVANETSDANNLSKTKDKQKAANDKQQQPSLISATTSLSESDSLCLNLRNTRFSSYSAMLESGHSEPQKPMAMSIQTYFMSFNDEEDGNEKSICEEAEMLPMNVELVGGSESMALSVATEVEVETNSTSNVTMSEVRYKPKVSTAEAVRERLRKRTIANVQKSSLPSETSMASILPKRRLSIDAVASIACKRQKVETTTLVDGVKQSSDPSPKLSSTYFSPIALPITSALDSISSKLKSPNNKNSAWDSMHMTPMVVVHSPAKPSQDTNQQVPNQYSSYPSDSMLHNIMESLFQTPIKNEAPDRVSPPCATDALNGNAGNQNISITTDHENGGICSTPLSTKPFPRFCPDDDPTMKHLSHKSSGEIGGSGRLKRSERKEPTVPLRPDAGRQGGDARKKVHQKPSEHVQTACLATKSKSDKHSKHIPKTETHTDANSLLRSREEKRLPTLSANDNSSQINEKKNNTPSLPTTETAKKQKVIPDKVSDPICENNTVTKQQPANVSSSYTMSKMAQRSATNVARSTLMHDRQTSNKVKPLKPPSKQERQKSMTHVEKSKICRNAPNSTKCKTEGVTSASAPSATNSITTIVSSKVSDAFPTQIPAGLRTRSQKQPNADRKRIDSSKKQSNEPPHLTASKKGGKEPNCDDENMQPVERNNVEPIPCTSRSIKVPEQADPQRLVEISTVAPFNKGNNVEMPNPQTQLVQPVKRNCIEPIACSSKNIKDPIKASPQCLVDRSTLVSGDSDHNMERFNLQTNAGQLTVPVNAAPAAHAHDFRDREEAAATCVVSNVTLNLSLADNTSKKHSSIRKSENPVQHVREMRIVKESPSLMRIFIRRK